MNYWPHCGQTFLPAGCSSRWSWSQRCSGSAWRPAPQSGKRKEKTHQQQGERLITSSSSLHSAIQKPHSAFILTYYLLNSLCFSCRPSLTSSSITIIVILLQLLSLLLLSLRALPYKRKLLYQSYFSLNIFLKMKRLVGEADSTTRFSV